MDGPIADAFTGGVDLFVCGGVIVGIVLLLASINMGNAEIAEQQAMQQTIAEYREYNQYDGKVVYAQDVVSAILMNRGDPEVRVRIGSNVYAWTETSSPCEWSTVAITNLIDQTRMYDAGIVRNANGAIVAYEFKAR